MARAPQSVRAALVARRPDVEQDTRRSLGFVGWGMAALPESQPGSLVIFQVDDQLAQLFGCQSIAEGALALTQPELALAGAPRGTNI